MAEGGLQKRVIFICGADHSGSTLIGCALSSEAGGHRDLFHVGECHAFFTKTNTKFGKHTPKASIWSKIDRNVPANLAYQEIFEKSGATTLIDSSKKLKWALIQARACQRQELEFKVIVTLRPFADLAHSLAKRGVSNEQIMKRIKYYSYLLRFIERIGPSTVGGVDTRLFCDKPAAQLQALCGTYDIPYFPGKELYWNYNHRHLFGAGMQQKHIRARAGSYETRSTPEESLSRRLQRRLRSSAIVDLETTVRSLIPKNLTE